MDDLVQLLNSNYSTALKGAMSDLRKVNQGLMEGILWDISEEELSGFLANISELVAILDENYCFVAVSQGYAAFFGISKQQLVGKALDGIHGREAFAENLRPGLEQALNNKGAQAHFWALNTHDEKRYLDCTISPLPRTASRKGAAAIVARDMTDLALAQTSLSQERKLLQLMINALPDFVFVKDQHGVYQYCNQAFETFLGLPKEQILGSDDKALMSPRSASYIDEQDRKVLKTGHARRVDEWVTYSDGRKRLLDMYKLPIHNDHGVVEGLLGIGRDVTSERQIAERMHQAALVFETTSDCCFILTPEGTVDTANNSAHSAFGYPNGSLKGFHINQLVQTTSGVDISSHILQQEAWRGEFKGFDLKGEIRPYIGTLNAVRDKHNTVTSFVLTLTDISEQKQFEEELIHQACEDPLTGLPNRLLMRSRAEHAIQTAQRNNSHIALLFIDLDGFKAINDTCGHEQGDLLLQQVSRRLSQEVRKVDTLSRLGGDEFLLLLDDLPDIEHVGIIADKLLRCFETKFNLKDRDVKLSASIGISFFPQNGSDVDELVHNADLAMYQAKRSGRNRYCIYQEDICSTHRL